MSPRSRDTRGRIFALLPAKLGRVGRNDRRIWRRTAASGAAGALLPRTMILPQRRGGRREILVMEQDAAVGFSAFSASLR